MSDMINQQEINSIYQEIVSLVKQARSNVLKSVNHEQVVAYWHIGKAIVEREQQGSVRAGYGKQIVKILSEKLTAQFGRGFSSTNLAYFKQFYLTYQNRIFHQAGGKSVQLVLNANLSWSHYRILMKESRADARKFYEVEAGKNHWSTPELRRQMTSFLFDRLTASKDTEKVMQLAHKGQVVVTPEDALKEPMVLDFLGYRQDSTYTETELESAIITHLQEFLLEMGAGFAFVARQKRITLDGDHFYPDLVFYHIYLKRYVVIELKTKALKHEDLGQIQMYVNYYDRYVKGSDENPTIGLLLCADKNDSIVEVTLPKDNNQIFARAYQFHLPTIEQLKQEITKEYQLAKARLEDKAGEQD